MKVFQINAVYGVMSTGRTMLQTCDFLLSQGHECLSGYGELRENYAKTFFIGSTLTHNAHAVVSRITGFIGKGSVIDTYLLINRIKTYSPDIVHLHNLHGNFVNIPILLKFLAGKDIPTVVTLHDTYFMTGGCMHYTRNGCYKWQRDCKGCKFLKFGSDYWLFNTAASNLALKRRLFNAIPRLGVIGVSEWITDEARHSPVFSKAKFIERVYNWVDLDIFKPQREDIRLATRQKYNMGKNFVILGVSASWSEKKGLPDFIKIADALSNREDINIVLVGDMEKSVTLPGNIINIPKIYDTYELSRIFSAADVFVHLSKEETFGKVTAEALACGTPAIVYDSTASPELVDENTGLVLEPNGDIQQAVDAVMIFYQRGKENFIKACRERATKEFKMETNLNLQLQLYKRLINE